MDFRKIFPILVIFISFYLTIASAKKSSQDKASHEIRLNSKETSQVEGISGELQVLKNLNNNNVTTSVKKPKHRRNKKHHKKGSHIGRGESRTRAHTKKRTNPTDILIADDEVKPKSDVMKTRSGKNRKTSTKIKSSNRSRGTRHLDVLDGQREFTNGHSAGNHHNHKHHKHRLGRRRMHHKKHKKVTTFENEELTLESPTLQDISNSAITP